jgi:hypothetical protein
MPLSASARRSPSRTLRPVAEHWTSRDDGRVSHSEASPPDRAPVGRVCEDEWTVWRDVRLATLTESPGSFGTCFPTPAAVQLLRGWSAGRPGDAPGEQRRRALVPPLQTTDKMTHELPALSRWQYKRHIYVSGFKGVTICSLRSGKDNKRMWQLGLNLRLYPQGLSLQLLTAPRPGLPNSAPQCHSPDR